MSTVPGLVEKFLVLFFLRYYLCQKLLLRFKRANELSFLRLSVQSCLLYNKGFAGFAIAIPSPLMGQHVSCVHSFKCIYVRNILAKFTSCLL